MQITTTEEIVTPEMASEWLEKHYEREFANRLHTLEVERGSAVQAFARFNRDKAKQGGGDNYMRALCSALRAWDKNEAVSFFRPASSACYWLIDQNAKLKTALVNCLRPKQPEETDTP